MFNRCHVVYTPHQFITTQCLDKTKITLQMYYDNGDYGDDDDDDDDHD